MLLMLCSPRSIHATLAPPTLPPPGGPDYNLSINRRHGDKAKMLMWPLLCPFWFPRSRRETFCRRPGKQERLVPLI